MWLWMKNLWLDVEEFLWLIVFYYCDIMELSDEEELDMEGFTAGFMMWFRTEYDDGQNNAWKCSGSSGSWSRCLTGSLIQQFDNESPQNSRKIFNETSRMWTICLGYHVQNGKFNCKLFVSCKRHDFCF